MTEFIGQWMCNIAGTALICSAAMTLTPKGKVKSVLHLLCGLLLICAMLTPIIKGDGPELSVSLAKYRGEAHEITEGAMKNSNELSRTIIEGELKAYILDKARTMDSEPEEFSLEMRWSSEGFWYPFSASIYDASISPLGKSRLSNLIEAELGIPAERQYWNDNGSEG